MALSALTARLGLRLGMRGCASGIARAGAGGNVRTAMTTAFDHSGHGVGGFGKTRGVSTSAETSSSGSGRVDWVGLSSLLLAQASISDYLHQHEITKSLVTKELVWFLASALLALPVFVIYRLLVDTFCTKKKRPSHNGNGNNGNRRHKRRHAEK